MLDWLFASHHHLKDTQRASSQSIFVVVFRINFLQCLKCFDCIVKVAHFVGIVANKLRQIIGISWCLGWDIDIPCIFGFTVHNVGPYQPFDVSILAFVLLVPDCQKATFCLFVVSNSCICERIIPVKVIICLEITFDAVEINHDIIELLQQEKAAGHGLSAWDSIALGGWSADKLEQLLCGFEMLFWVLLLDVHQIWNCFDDVLSWVCRLEIFD